VLLDNIKLVDRGSFLEAEIRRLLGSGPYPSRNVDANIADLKAQLAANEKGVQELRRIVAHFGLATTQAYMGHVQDNAEESVRRVLAELAPGRFECPMDDGAVIVVAVAIGIRSIVTLEKQLLNNYGRKLGIKWLSCTAK
jgi:5-oxoprolinase (ATP-hydrolysing)